MMCMIYVIVLKYVTQCNGDVCVDDYHLLFLLSVRPITVVKGIVGVQPRVVPGLPLQFGIDRNGVIDCSVHASYLIQVHPTFERI